MALSNWDTLAINEEGKSIRGFFKTPLGVVVEIYKNWLYIHDKNVNKADKGESYVDDVVMEVRDGELTYRDLHIIARRGPSNGVYTICWFHKYEDKKAKEPEEFKFMIGTGIYGYDDSGEWLGVRDINIKILKEMYKKWIKEDGYEFKKFNPFKGELLRYNQGDEFFSNKIDGLELPATSPGEAEEPILQKMIIYTDAE